jgi:hypothetical protein
MFARGHSCPCLEMLRQASVFTGSRGVRCVSLQAKENTRGKSWEVHFALSCWFAGTALAQYRQKAETQRGRFRASFRSGIITDTGSVVAEESCTGSSSFCMVTASEILRAPVLKNEQCPGTRPGSFAAEKTLPHVGGRRRSQNRSQGPTADSSDRALDFRP